MGQVGRDSLSQLFGCQAGHSKLFVVVVFAGGDGEGRFGAADDLGEEGDQLLVGLSSFRGGGDVDLEGVGEHRGNPRPGAGRDDLQVDHGSIMGVADFQGHGSSAYTWRGGGGQIETAESGEGDGWLDC